MQVYELATFFNDVPRLSYQVIVNEEVIDGIHVSAGLSMQGRYEPFFEAMRGYSLDQILNQYGKPSRILVGLKGGPSEANAPWLYSLWLFYDHAGVLVHYEGEGMSREGQMLQVCPSYDDIWYINLYLQSPENAMPLEGFEKSLSGRSIEALLLDRELFPLEQVADITIDEFQSMFETDDGPDCFVSHVDVW